MGKPQNVEKKNGNQAKGNKGKAIQEGKIKKNKQPKSKQTPTGKVAIINGKSNGNNVQKKPVQSPTKGAPAKKSPQQQQQQQGQGKKNQKQKQKQQKVPAKKEVQKKKPVKKEEDEDDSEVSDIDEGITSIKEDVSMNGSEEDSDDESGEDELDIFGQSLADDTDDDDEDFDDDDDEEEEKNGQKGIKPFKGIKAKSEEEEDDDDDDDDEDEDEDEDDETDAMDTTETSSLNSSVTENDDSEEEDDEEEDDDDDDDEDEDESKTGLKALMGDSLVDDENDEDFEEDDDDDDEDDDDISEESEATELNQSATSPTKSEDGKKISLTPEEKAELDKRTIFIGNVPMAVEEKKIKATFKTFGPIETIRIRGVVAETPNIPLKVAVIKKKYHPKATAKCAFIVFKSEDSAVKALSLNGTQLEGNYLRVDRATEDRKIDSKKAIFLGNIPFDAEDNEIWEMFKKCGKIDWVRTIRDRRSGLCRGIAYVNFKNEDSVALAINLDGQMIKKRPIRVTRYKPTEKKEKKVVAGKKRPRSADGAGSPAKKSKPSVEQATKNSVNAERRTAEKVKRSQGQKQRTQNDDVKPQVSPKAKGAFQGHKADNKKKFKKGGNKFEKKKQHMAAKLTAKPKKPVK